MRKQHFIKEFTAVELGLAAAGTAGLGYGTYKGLKYIRKKLKQKKEAEKAKQLQQESYSYFYKQKYLQ